METCLSALFCLCMELNGAHAAPHNAHVAMEGIDYMIHRRTYQQDVGRLCSPDNVDRYMVLEEVNRIAERLDQIAAEIRWEVGQRVAGE